MLANLRELYSLLTAAQRRRLLRLQVLVVLMSFAEVAGVLSIGPFMALVAGMEQLQGDGTLAQVYLRSGLDSPEQFLIWLGVGVLGALTLAAMISMFTIWRLSMFGARVGEEIASRLYHYYMYKPWLFHAEHNSSKLTKQISTEARRVSANILKPLMQMNAKLVMCLFMVTAMFIYNPVVALVGVSIFICAYLILFRVVRSRLIKNGRRISTYQGIRFKLMAEGFGGVKDAMLLNRQNNFTIRFEDNSFRLARAQGVNQAISQVPRYAMELVAYGSVIALVLYLLAVFEGDASVILPVLSVYALAGFKLLPAFQQIYTSVAQIRGNLAAFEVMQEDLRASTEQTVRDSTNARDKQVRTERLTFRQSLVLENIHFRYPSKQGSALRGLDLEIPVNSVIGLVGPSGSGKSTTVDTLLGLLQPDQGRLLVDGVPLDENNLRAWQNIIGFVPQHIFLSDNSIRENIAFGLAPEQIDEVRVKRAAILAHLDEMIAELPTGMDTRIGERGVQLSGGQRQRIGIARALYADAEVLVLDEATSALDGITERIIMDAIHDFAGKKTVIMIAHRIQTVRQCDVIHLFERGRVVASGTYDELMGGNEVFRRMSMHS